MPFKMHDDDRKLVARDFARRLGRGEEICWDYLPGLVQQGAVHESFVRYNLEKCLEECLPEYRRNARYGDKAYWGKRLEEANEALSSIKNGTPVKFRGISL